MTTPILIELSGGAELLFDNVKSHKVILPESSDKSWTIALLLPWIRDNLLKERPELFLDNSTVRPGILVLVNDTDWELLNELEYEIKPNDVITFISTLHESSALPYNLDYIIYYIVFLSPVFSYAIVYKKGYQEFGTPDSITTTKLKGVAYVDRPDKPAIYNRVWDTADIVVPPLDPKYAKCIPKNNTCVNGQPSGGGVGNGIMTGKCVKYPKKPHIFTCEVMAWCDVEEDQTPTGPLIPQAENFTLLIKNFVEFSKFNVKLRNIVGSINNKSYLTGCRYHASDAPLCPVFRVGDMIAEAQKTARHGFTFEELATQGGVVSIVIDWDCNFDFKIEHCQPKYSFSRLDEANATIAPGWNFRYANNYRVNDVDTRDLYKVYGILFVITVQGRAGKFNVVPLVLNIGSGLALLALAGIICDVLILYVVKKRQYYTDKKYLKLVEDQLLLPPTSEDSDIVNDDSLRRREVTVES